MNLFHQYELVKGNRHRMAWLDGEGLSLAKRDNWVVLNAYMQTGLVKSAKGRLHHPDNKPLDD